MSQPPERASERTVRVHELLRYGKAASREEPSLDGVANFFYLTGWLGKDPMARLQLESGISWPEPVRARDGSRIAVVLVRSNPHRAGTAITPWEDYFDTDRGHILYYGDNKVDTARDAALQRGNSMLLRQFALHQSANAEERSRSAPLVFFRGVDYEGKQKGYLRFEGYGIVERAERVTQWDPRKRINFGNYRFDCLVMGLQEEDEQFSWRWINARRDPALSLFETLALAPAASLWEAGPGARPARTSGKPPQAKSGPSNGTTGARPNDSTSVWVSPSQGCRQMQLERSLECQRPTARNREPPWTA